MAALGHYSPRLLSVYESEGGLYSEPIEFLGALFNGELAPMQLPYEDLGMHIPARRISFGRNAIELSANGHLPRKFSAIVSVKDYAAQTTPGMFDAIMRLPCEMTVQPVLRLCRPGGDAWQNEPRAAPDALGRG